MSAGLHVVLGATGGVGGAVVGELLARGLPVRAVTRRDDAPVPRGVQRLTADVSTAAGATAACEGAAVVYHCAQPAYNRWPEEFPAMNEAVIAGATAAGAKLVFADNLYMYAADGRPITEDTPEQPSSKKGRVRAGLAQRLREVHRSGQLRTTMGRAADYYGPGGTDSAAGEMLFGAVLRGKPVAWPGDPDAPHTFHYLGDIAAGLVTLGQRDDADGRAWILPAPAPITARRFIERVAAQAGQRATVRRVPKPVLRLAGLFIPPAREIPDIWYQFSKPFTVDATRFERTFGPAPATPYADAIATTLTWFRDRQR